MFYTLKVRLSVDPWGDLQEAGSFLDRARAEEALVAMLKAGTAIGGEIVASPSPAELIRRGWATPPV